MVLKNGFINVSSKIFKQKVIGYTRGGYKMCHENQILERILNMHKAIPSGRIAELGTLKCITCAEEIPRDRYNPVTIKLPKEILDARTNKYLPDSLKGHMTCCRNIGFLFYQPDALPFTCKDCAYLLTTTDGSLIVLEECKYLELMSADGPGTYARDPACNFFRPNAVASANPDMKKAIEVWKKLLPEIEQDTMEGYQNLRKILENIGRM